MKIVDTYFIDYRTHNKQRQKTYKQSYSDVSESEPILISIILLAYLDNVSLDLDVSDCKIWPVLLLAQANSTFQVCSQV